MRVREELLGYKQKGISITLADIIDIDALNDAIDNLCYANDIEVIDEGGEMSAEWRAVEARVMEVAGQEIKI